ncbi:Ecd family protein [Abortiporus biennis]
MDIFNRLPTISEDTLQYLLYPPSNLSDKASTTTLAVVMQDFSEELLPNHLWHRDNFQLKVQSNKDGEGWCIGGRMRVGDCVDDEWCTVWVLKEISAKWDVAINVSDSDGEFLLIEAAEYLPSWVTPTNSENRVWIYNSRLHMIPLTHVSSVSSKPTRRQYSQTLDSDDEGLSEPDEENEAFLSIQDAIRIVRDPTIDTLAPPEVEHAVNQRIRGYPAAAAQHIHNTNAYLPVDIAKALSINPYLVQKAIETFYTRDALQLRAAHRMSRFTPEPSVLATIKMTRPAYAQLVGQKFYPPKVFGHLTAQEGTPEWRWRDIGMKIACGFEMLYQESKNKNAVLKQKLLSDDARKVTLYQNPDFLKYLDNLKSSGYFRNEIEGSALWKDLEQKASVAFIDARNDSIRSSFSSDVDAAALKAGLYPISVNKEDPDDWLNVDAEHLESMLERAMGSQDTSTGAPVVEMQDTIDEDVIAKEQATKLQRLAKKVEEFIEGEGDLEGALFQGEASSEDFSDNGSNETSDEETESKSEDEHETRKAALEALVPGIDPSEYGRMPPSFHSNSQRVARTTIETDVVGDIDEKPAEDPLLYARPIRPPILSRDKYEGVDTDDESGEEDEVDEESEEDKPQIVGDIDIDMGEEQDEFIEFARQALGVSDEQWYEIVRERRVRGVFVPANSKSIATSKDRPADPTLDSFEAVMKAMDAELERNREKKHDTKPASSKGKQRATESDEHQDIEMAMDAELKAALEDGDEGSDEGTGDEHVDYNLIKNFLESFKSQGGLSGPVSNMLGRLEGGFKLPRDES